MLVYEKLSGFEKEALGVLISCMKRGFESAAGKLLALDVKAEGASVGQASAELLKPAHGDRAVIIRGVLSGKISGPLDLLINEPELLPLIAKMLGLDDGELRTRQASGLGTGDMDGVKSVGEVIFFDIAEVLSERLAAPVSSQVETVHLKAFDLGMAGPLSDSAVAATYSFGERGTVSFIVGDALFSSMSRTADDEKVRAEEAAGDPAKRKIKLQNLMELRLPLAVILAERTILLRNIFEWTNGTIVEFGKNHEDPLDIYVSDRAIASGEAVKFGENFGVRVRKIGTPKETIEKLRPS
jgi:flagellar motor switch protein FliN/FliY